ncbi:MAG: hypothetical protein KGI27_09865 [Thaumarchaeota archaeon]|nr:hypothetical protein [Nitrososphaerota archaeon]
MDKFKELFDPLVPGDFAEFGVYNGNGARELASLDPSRTCWAFDTFEGMPQEDYSGDEDSSDPPGKWKPSAEPEALFHGIPNITAIKGRFVDTLGLVNDEVHFSLVHVDCDWYWSHRQVLEFLESHLNHGAKIVFDDWTLAGAKRAIQEWRDRVGPKVKGEGEVLVWVG